MGCRLESNGNPMRFISKLTSVRFNGDVGDRDYSKSSLIQFLVLLAHRFCMGDRCRDAYRILFRRHALSRASNVEPPRVAPRAQTTACTIRLVPGSSDR
jgi:hypothetical protein